MSPRQSPATHCHGFTLVELVVCIVLTAIVASFIILFLATPLQEYFQQSSRAALIDSADRIANDVTAEVRTALPNSLRVASNPAQTLWSLEFLQTQGVARYHDLGDTPQGMAPGTATSQFATIDSFASPAAARLSIGNLGKAGHDAYAAGSATMTSKNVSVTALPSPPSGEEQVTLGASTTFAPDGLPTPVHNAYLVQGPVSYVCDSRAGTLMRYWGYRVRAVQRQGFGTKIPRALIARNVASCRFSVFQDRGSPGYRYGEVAILNVTLASNGETFQVFLQAPTEYSR
jgi:MSHA biogenesis protein MshO